MTFSNCTEVEEVQPGMLDEYVRGSDRDDLHSLPESANG